MGLNKGGFEIGFGWIFSILVGAIIIFLAIFATTRIIDVERFEIDTEAGQEIGILLTPLETGADSSRSSKITMPVETRIFTECFNEGNFGVQEISVSTKSGIGKEWQDAGFPSIFHNKYLFSDSENEGRIFAVFAKPFEMPFKIADLTFVISEKEKYCFFRASDDIEEDILRIGIDNFVVVENLASCPRESKRVCFDSSECDINVDENGKSVKRNRRTE